MVFALQVGNWRDSQTFLNVESKAETGRKNCLCKVGVNLAYSRQHLAKFATPSF